LPQCWRHVINFAAAVDDHQFALVVVVVEKEVPRAVEVLREVHLLLAAVVRSLFGIAKQILVV